MIINNNLSINEKYTDMQILNIHISVLNKNLHIFKQIGEIIQFNKDLNTLIIFVLFEGIDDNNKSEILSKFEEFDKILIAIKENSSLKNIFINFENCFYTLNDKINNSLLDLIKDEKFLTIFIVGYTFNEIFLEKFMSFINGNKKLLFLGIHFSEDLLMNSLEIIIKILPRHPSLIWIFISGGNLKFENVSKLKESFENLKIFEYLYNLKI